VDHFMVSGLSNFNISGSRAASCEGPVRTQQWHIYFKSSHTLENTFTIEDKLPDV